MVSEQAQRYEMTEIQQVEMDAIAIESLLSLGLHVLEELQRLKIFEILENVNFILISQM